MVAFYKEVCIIYGAEHPLHILWLCNFISGLVAQLGERSVRIREVVGSNPIRSTIRSAVILIELRWIFLLLLSDVPVGTAVFTERKWRSLRPASWCRSPQPGKYRRILLLPSAKPPEAVRHRAHRLRRLFLCKPYSAAFRLLSHFQLRTSADPRRCPGYTDDAPPAYPASSAPDTPPGCPTGAADGPYR